MRQSVEKLYAISKKSSRLIIGLMSGTSLDGLDVALCHLKGSGLNTKAEILEFETVAYNAAFKEEIKQVFSKEQVSLEKLTLLNPWVALQHAAIINSLLKKWNIAAASVDIIASHGQTIYHAPKSLHKKEKFGNATLQIGDGDHLAVATGIITISDFRQKHIAAGGEGAPLAVYGDYILFGKKDEDRILLNIGGIANFTYLPGSMDINKMLSTDTGPGNTMMDAYVQKHFPGKFYDENAAIASNGKINQPLLTELMKNDFFSSGFPKTTGPELFNLAYLQNAIAACGLQNISHENVLATLAKFSATATCNAVKKLIAGKTEVAVYSSGGGMHNPLLMQFIKDELSNCRFYTTSELNINPDAKEALLFAVLANECVAAEDNMFKLSMGKISLPV